MLRELAEQNEFGAMSLNSMDKSKVDYGKKLRAGLQVREQILSNDNYYLLFNSVDQLGQINTLMNRCYCSIASVELTYSPCD